MEPIWDQSMLRRDFLKMGALAAGSALSLAPLSAVAEKPSAKGEPPSAATANQQTIEPIAPKDYSHLLGQVQGLSDAQLLAHFKLYENYVSKANLLHQLIAQADARMLAEANPAYSTYREMHLEQSYAHNGVILHELYFGNLAPHNQPSWELDAMITRGFGSWENYQRHLIATGKAMRGWAITGLDLRDGTLRNFGLDLHNQWSCMHMHPLLVLDVYEHAYMIDFGTDRTKYLDVFMRNINWQAVHDRLIFAVHHLMAGPASTN